MNNNNNIPSKKEICIICRQKFSPVLSLGKLECHYHPYLLERIHFPTPYICCNIDEFVSHKLIYNYKLYGCTKIDHCVTSEELHNLLNNPVKMIYELSFKGDKKSIIYRIDKVEDINRSIRFKNYKSQTKTISITNLLNGILINEDKTMDEFKSDLINENVKSNIEELENNNLLNHLIVVIRMDQTIDPYFFEKLKTIKIN